MNLQSILSQRAGAFVPSRSFSEHISPSMDADTIRDNIAALRRSFDAVGDYPECEALAVATLAELCRMSIREAWSAWITYAAGVDPQ